MSRLALGTVVTTPATARTSGTAFATAIGSATRRSTGMSARSSPTNAQSSQESRRRSSSASNAGSFRAVGSLPRLLDRVSGVVDDRSAARGPEAAEAAHVHDEIAVPEERAPLRHGELWRTACANLFHGPHHPLG